MAAPDVQRLLAAVRQHLWREQFAAAVRMAAWVTAGGVLLAAAVHGAVLALPVDAVLTGLGLLWSALLARAAWRRPDDPTCALWVDRHLGGASAFTTLLDAGRQGSERAHGPAVRSLQDWAAARAPFSLRELAARRDPARLARPLLTLAVCSALATLVLTLPGVAPAPPPPAATPARAAVPEAALRLADAPEAAALAQEVSNALRAAQPRDTDPPGGGSRAPAAGPAQPDVAGPSASASADPAPESARATHKTMPSGTATNTGAAATSATQSAGSGGGREAGDSADTRSDPGASRALRGTMAVQGAALEAGRPSAQRRAASDQAASYESDDSESTRSEASAVRALPPPAAATPPPATVTTRLTPTETHYVQAWMRASERRP